MGRGRSRNGPRSDVPRHRRYWLAAADELPHRVATVAVAGPRSSRANVAPPPATTAAIATDRPSSDRVKNNWPPAALPEIPDEKEETCALPIAKRVSRYSAKLTILTREEMGPPADGCCDAGKRNFTKVHVNSQLLGNSQTCPKAFNEVVELSVGVSSPLASNRHISLCLGLSTR
ncbi:hypothetical protein ALC62_10698 [Cyphomyrmex costatus]|uniref:Uncharacterized protein n=1 Tax=Cyphomyrmex costatus TaxID=456900 RepID=A0A195CDE6_9HYME|nr:hypothetical protein ALC62_10698 [Cyphomyrmex costatus]